MAIREATGNADRRERLRIRYFPCSPQLELRNLEDDLLEEKKLGWSFPQLELRKSWSRRSGLRRFWLDDSTL